MRMALKARSTPLKDNRATAEQLMANYAKYDRWAAEPVVLGKTGEGEDKGGFPAQYYSGAAPPLLEKRRYYEKLTGKKNLNISIPFTDKDVETIKQKEKMAMLARFDLFVTRNFDPSLNPTRGEWLQKIYPEYFDARKKEKDEIHRLRSQYEDIVLYGPKNKDDLYLLYRIDQDVEMRARISGNTSMQTANIKSYKDVDGPKFQRGLWNWWKEERRKDAKAGILGATSAESVKAENPPKYPGGYRTIISNTFTELEK